MDLLQKWEEAHGAVTNALETIVDYLHALQPPDTAPSEFLKGVADELGTVQLRSYVERGGRCAMHHHGWQKAKDVEAAAMTLVEQLDVFGRLLRELHQWIDREVSELEMAVQAATLMEAAMERRDDVFLLATRIDQLEREQEILATFLSDVNVFAAASAVQSYLVVWKLRPFVDGELTAQLRSKTKCRAAPRSVQLGAVKRWREWLPSDEAGL